MSSQGKKLQEEQWFYELLEGDPPPELNRLRRFNARSALDLGCGEGFALIYLYYSLGIDHLEGVDKRSASAVLQELNKRLKEKQQQSVGVSSIGELFIGARPCSTNVRPLLSKSEDYQHLLRRVRYDVDVVNYKPESDSVFDIVVASHLMHYLKPQEFQLVAQLILDRSHAQSLVYYSTKPEFAHREPGSLHGAELLSHCRALADRLIGKGLDIKEYLGPMSQGNGQCYIFTNL